MNLSPPYPPVSANTLFHFTANKENLINILVNEFRPHFCLEDLSILEPRDREDPESAEIAIPMVSFCDLPLSQIGFHLSVYGDYGIGMSKTWAMRKGITPVLYLHDDSQTGSGLNELLDHSKINLDDQNLPTAMGERFLHLISFFKAYEGDLWREGGTLSNVRFYNEREWRFVPRLPIDSYRELADKGDFLDSEKRKAANEKLAEGSRISFEPNDIKYLIVRREDEIVQLIRDVELIKGKYSHEDVLLLSSRIISAEQIRTDF